MANGCHLFRPEDKDKLDFSEPEYNHSLPPYCSLIRVSSNLYVASNELLSSERPAFTFPNGLCFPRTLY